MESKGNSVSPEFGFSIFRFDNWKFCTMIIIKNIIVSLFMPKS